MLDGDAHQLRQRAHAELRLELRAGVVNRLLANVKMLGDDAIGLAFGDQRQGL